MAGAYQGDAFKNDTFEVVLLVNGISSVLPSLTTTVTAITPIRGPVASTLPSLASASTASVFTPATITSPLPSLASAGTILNGTFPPAVGTIASSLGHLSQSVIAGLPQLGTVVNVLPSLTTSVTAIRGTVTPATGPITTVLPKLATAFTAHSGAGAPSVGAVTQVLGAMSMSSTLLVSTPTPPPTPSGVQGLVHIFIKDGASRILPTSLTGGHSEMVGQFRDRSSMVGGFQSATASISPTEYNSHTTIYTVGATWIVKDLALETAGLNPYIFGGELKQPQVAGGVVELAADGWGLLQDRNVERFLVASMALDAWAPGDEDPFKFPGGARILAEVRAARLVFEVKRKTHFTRNDAGQPGTWRSVPLVFWAPKTDLRWIAFKINATGRSMSQYDLELVGTPTGPTGTLTVLQTWNLNNNLADASKSFQIPAGYDLIGLRVVRSSEAKRAPHVRVTISDVKVGSLATSEPYTLNQAFTALFGKMGAASTTIAANTMNIVPYDAARVPLSDIADDLAIFGQWYWRMWADSTGVMRGEAGPIGQTNYDVQLVHTPIRLLPQPRFNVVQFDYAYGGGYTSQDVVRASPDPFPGTDIVYTLDLPEAPTFALAQAFAQQIANILSKAWYSGSGTLNKVDPGNKPAGVVKPGDQLTLLNYGSVKVIVDEMSHSEDGSIVEASFSESSKLVDRWLARFQQRINRGLSPNAAVIDLLDIAEPKAPTINAGFSVSQKREGRKDYDLQAIATTVSEDIEGVGTYVSRYEFRARPIYPVGHASAGQPIPDNKGGGWRHRGVRAPKDGEADETKAATFAKITNPKDWAWEVQGWAVDALGQKSNRATTNAGRPVGLGPPNPTSASLDVDQHVMRVTHTIPADPDDPTEPHQDYHHAIIKVNDTNSNWGTPLRVDRKVKAETKSFRFHKPIDGQTYYAQITYVDWWGNQSATPLVVNNSKKVPPLPVIGTPDFDANGSRHARYRLRVPVTINDASHDDHIKRILVQCSHKTTNVTPVLADKKFRDWVRTNDDPQEALFRNLPKTHYVFVRAMTVDADQKESGWSSWVAMGRPKDSGVTVTPPQPTWQAVAGTINVTTPTPRRLVVNWDDPDDDEATRWRVVIKQGVTVKDTIRTRNTRAVYRVPTADVGLTHTAEVYATNDLGVESTVVTGSGSPTPDAGGTGNPPNQPGNPTLAFDTSGTKHAKYRALVTAGASAVDGTHDAAHRYIIQLVHHQTSGASPPAGAKRQHGAVEGDATGDDLQEVFRNIPKNHYVWVRQRARNAAGASTWTGWQGAVQPSGAIAPAVAGAVTATAPTPRRVKATWADPNDEETVRWRIEVKRATTIVENGNTRSNRYIYHVPQADVGQSHTVLVYAVSDTATEAAASTSNAVTPSADTGVGNPPNVPSNPSFVTDGRGSRHAKFRVIVTAGTSVVDGSHDAAHAYILQIAHDATDSGANPPVGAKRQHGRVEGDATGDDLQEVFRSIPKRHYLWVRERATNAAGPSAWTGWRTASRSIDFGVAVAPNAPTGVAVSTPAPRRVKVTWNDPDDDETIRWRVEIRRSGGTVETGFTRSTRYIYHVPKAFTNVAHQARVFAISDTGTDSSQVDSLDGIPNDDAAGYDIGDIIPRGHAAVPSGWLLCNGSTTTPISAYPSLFALYGTLYGGDGVNTFGVPDIRGRHPVGVGTNVALGGDEGDSETNRSAIHIHGSDTTPATPADGDKATTPGDGDLVSGLGDDSPGATPTGNANQDGQDHTHSLGMNTGSADGTAVAIGSGATNASRISHGHNVPGPTGGRGAQHDHNHGHGSHPHPHAHGSHGHSHGHGGHGHGHGHGNHPHPHPHDQKKRPHKGMHWIVKAA